jgi:hypothetical protein
LARLWNQLVEVVQGELNRLRATFQRLQDPVVMPTVTVAQLNTSAGGSNFYRNSSAGRVVWVTNMSGGAAPAYCNASGGWVKIASAGNVS